MFRKFLSRLASLLKKEDPNYRLSSNYLRLNYTVAHAFRVFLQRHDLFVLVVDFIKVITGHHQHLESLVDVLFTGETRLSPTGFPVDLPRNFELA